MAKGDGADDAALDAAWARYCDRLKAAGAQAFKDANPADGLARADAFRFLTQNLGQAFDLALETRDPGYPLLHAFCNPTRKLGGDCADFTYVQAWIDGSHAYRITGNRGTARFVNFTVQGARPERMANGAPPLHDPFGDVPQANLFGDQLETEPDGSFELFIGGEAREGNWLATTPDTRKLFIRQGFDAWDERPATMRIERIGMAEPRPLPDPAETIAAIDWAGIFLTEMMAQWPDWAFAHGGVDAEHPNRFPGMADGEEDRKRGRAAAAMHWRLAPDEAIIVTFDAHDGLWMFSNGGAFMNSMDFLYRPVSYTPARTRVDGDDRIRLVMAHRDPGFANWIDTQGFSRGNLTYRHMLGGAPVPIETRVVKIGALSEAMPTDSARSAPGERIAEMHRRFEAVQRRYTVWS